MKSLHHFITPIKHYILLCDDLVIIFMFYKCKVTKKDLKIFPFSQGNTEKLMFIEGVWEL